MRLPPKLTAKLGRWQLALLAFALFYAAVLIFNLDGISLQWDELNHFNGAILLIRGQIWDYIGFNSYYPPLYNLVTTGYFLVGGASVITGRLVTVTFSVLSLFVVYKIGREMFGEKVGVTAAVLFAVMPGVVLLSSLAMIEMMLIFVFCVSLLFFFRWLSNNQQRDLTISVATLIIGVLVKYQVLVVAPIIIVVGLLFLGRNIDWKSPVSTVLHSRRVFILVALLGIAVVLLYAFYASGLMAVWIYAISVGGEIQAEYSSRFFTPIFYFIEMVWPYEYAHPVSLLLYGLGLAGLALFAVRHKPQDKYLLIWFLATYAVFTLVPNRNWRYITLLFPVLALSAAELVAFVYGGAQKFWQSTESTTRRKRLAKVGASLLIAFTAFSTVYSSVDAYTWTQREQSNVPIQEAADYLNSHQLGDRSAIVLCPFNLFNRDMLWFYLNSAQPSQIPVYQYPKLAVDAYKPDFNITYFTNYCQQNKTAYVLLYEYGATNNYYNSTLNEQAVANMLNGTGKFTLQASVGLEPNRIHIYTFK